MIDAGCLILAAGANERLKGIVPSFMKPLILVNGKPLIRHAFDHAVEVWKIPAYHITIVAAPQNIREIVELLGDAPNYVIQPTPSGVLAAIGRASPLLRHQWSLILMGDNTFSSELPVGLPGSLIRASCPYTGAIAIRKDIGHFRFTRLDTTSGQHPVVLPRDSTKYCDAVWIGPLLLDTRILLHELPAAGDIEDLIMRCTEDGTRLIVLPMHCNDLGVPEELNHGGTQKDGRQ